MTSDTENTGKGRVHSFALKNELTQLDQLHTMVESFGHDYELPKRIIFEINLVLEELFTNIVSYGHNDDKLHQIHFSLERDKDCINIHIEDDGVPFNLLQAEPVELETDLEHRSIGGLGIHLIQKLMDNVTYKRIGSKNVVTLRKNYGS